MTSRPIAFWYSYSTHHKNMNAMKHVIAVLCISSLFFLFGFKQQEQLVMKQMQDNKKISSLADLSGFSP